MPKSGRPTHSRQPMTGVSVFQLLPCTHHFQVFLADPRSRSHAPRGNANGRSAPLGAERRKPLPRGERGSEIVSVSIRQRYAGRSLCAPRGRDLGSHAPRGNANGRSAPPRRRAPKATPTRSVGARLGARSGVYPVALRRAISSRTTGATLVPNNSTARIILLWGMELLPM